jgi:hypothetical protein
VTMAIYPDPKVSREMSERGAGSRVHAFKRAQTPYTGYQKQGADILPPNSLLQHAVQPTSLLQTTSNAGRVCHQAATTMLTNFPIRSGPKTRCQTCLPTHPVPS